MLAPGEVERVRICASQTCSARFFDRSPAGRRRWCSMQTCGSREKMRRMYERKRAERGSAPGIREAMPEATEAAGEAR
jgi:predicted RNA-binding Zn ribbon-like protein